VLSIISKSNKIKRAFTLVLKYYFSFSSKINCILWFALNMAVESTHAEFQTHTFPYEMKYILPNWISHVISHN
jgi:hypothetical protein